MKELSEQATLEQAKSGFNFFLAIPNSELYRLVVDGCRHKDEQGFVGYEARESGSVRCFLNAILEKKDFVNSKEPVTIELFKEIHRVCSPGGRFFPGQFKETYPGTSHGFGIYQLSIEGLKDLCDFADRNKEFKVSYYDNNFVIHKLNLYGINMELSLCRRPARSKPNEEQEFKITYAVSLTKENTSTLAESTINKLNNTLAQANNDNTILEAIVECIYELEHAHMFHDANLRSNMILANLLLMQHGFPPVSYFDPNYLDGVSKAEFFNIMKEGMLKTLDIIEHPNEAHFNFKSSSLSADAQKTYADIIKPITESKEKLNYSVPNEINQQIQLVRERIQKLQQNPEPKWIINDFKFHLENSDIFSEYVSLNVAKHAQRNSFFNNNNNNNIPSYQNSSVNNYPQQSTKDTTQDKDEITSEPEKIESCEESEEMFYRRLLKEVLDSNETSADKIKTLSEVGTPSGVDWTILDLVSEEGASEEIIEGLREYSTANLSL
ncbi:ankyrin repeat-containing protein [Legionella beliardensis]|uniref:Ankyrin repeat-containing protein n=1 Tax=Legionella beliardensis TaxID=91822 RepID=A0A378I0Q6_9GAMM|nr:Fic family protein [Legionella beliardensis]STX28331.1 ankyrin repeat-containing protein [Legionella beliardensis]